MDRHWPPGAAALRSSIEQQAAHLRQAMRPATEPFFRISVDDNGQPYAFGLFFLLDKRSRAVAYMVPPSSNSVELYFLAQFQNTWNSPYFELLRLLTTADHLIVCVLSEAKLQKVDIFSCNACFV